MFDIAMRPAQDLKAYAQSLKAAIPTGSGNMQFLRFSKHGEWTAGAEQTPVDGEGDEFLVNVYAFKHGFIQYAGTETREIAVSMVEPLPAVASLPPASPESENGWQLFVGAMLARYGDDSETPALYSWTAMSVGGRQAFAKLAEQVIARMSDGSPYHFPVVALRADNYINKKYGKTFVPVFEVIAWADVDGNEEEGEEELEAYEQPPVALPPPAPVAAPKPRRAAAAPVEQAAPAQIPAPVKPPARRARV